MRRRCNMNNIIIPPPQSLDFAPDIIVAELDRGNLFKIRREVDGRPREMVLAPIEALLCSLLERGENPRDFLGDALAADAGVQDRLARLPSALRAFLMPNSSVGCEVRRSPVFADPHAYLQACRDVPAKEHFLLRDIAPQELVWYVTPSMPATLPLLSLGPKRSFRYRERQSAAGARSFPDTGGLARWCAASRHDGRRTHVAARSHQNH